MSHQVQEQEQGKGNDGPPVEEDNDESEGANAEQSVCEEEWGEPGQNDYVSLILYRHLIKSST